MIVFLTIKLNLTNKKANIEYVTRHTLKSYTQKEENTFETVTKGERHEKENTHV